mmetsp:Transcript_31384/g.71655  ORF Transcript_31384/g.71655 Transcript_31384/m.71655 type:complete len:210 (-) Transcript_31384:3360-3989(-)
MITSPARISEVLGKMLPLSATPTTKPVKSVASEKKIPGISLVLAPRRVQLASTHASATPSSICSTCCASSFGAAKWFMKNKGFAPKDATSLQHNATISMPKAISLPMAVATFTLVPTLLVLLKSTGSTYSKEAKLQSPSSHPSCKVFCNKGLVMMSIASCICKSTPADLYAGVSHAPLFVRGLISTLASPPSPNRSKLLSATLLPISVR